MRWEIAMAIAFLAMLGGGGVLLQQLRTLPPTHDVRLESLAAQPRPVAPMTAAAIAKARDAKTTVK